MGALSGSASGEIDAPLAEVWAVVEDTASAPEWQGGMDSMEVIERDSDGRPELVETRTDAKVRTVKTEMRFGYERPTRVEWAQEDGDLKSIEGHWELEDLGDGTTRLRAVSLFMTAEDRDGMMQSGMEQGMNESHAALDRVLVAM